MLVFITKNYYFFSGNDRKFSVMEKMYTLYRKEKKDCEE